MKERALQNTIRNALAGECLLFRANVGQAWTGDTLIPMPNGDVLIKNARPFNTGLPPGFSDTFGLVPVLVTPAMVGQTFGIFLAGEVKTARGVVSEKQGAFLRAVNDNGGAGCVWRSADDALAMVNHVKKHGRKPE